MVRTIAPEPGGRLAGRQKMALGDGAPIGIPCPGCGEKTEKTIRWLKANDRFTCTCGAEITVDSTKLIAGLQETEAAAKGFQKR
jgi:hypothetical protein